MHNKLLQAGKKNDRNTAACNFVVFLFQSTKKKSDDEKKKKRKPLTTSRWGGEFIEKSALRSIVLRQLRRRIGNRLYVHPLAQ